MISRFTRLHARMLAAWARGLADELDRLVPGPPLAGTLYLLSNGKVYMNTVQFTDEEGPFNAVGAFVDAKGFPTPPDTTPTWTTDNEAAVAVTDNGDGTAVVTLVAPGQAIVTCAEQETDDQTGEVSTVACQVSITVTAGDAVTGDITLTPVA